MSAFGEALLCWCNFTGRIRLQQSLNYQPHPQQQLQQHSISLVVGRLAGQFPATELVCGCRRFNRMARLPLECSSVEIYFLLSAAGNLALTHFAPRMSSDWIPSMAPRSLILTDTLPPAEAYTGSSTSSSRGHIIMLYVFDSSRCSRWTGSCRLWS